MKRSPFFSEMAQLPRPPVVAEVQGWQVPITFTTAADEHRTVRERVGLMDWSTTGEFEVKGPDALDVVQRHAALRTTFSQQDGVYRQVVAPSLELRLETRDLTDLPSGEREQAARRFLEEETARPFDLEAGPLFRSCLLRLSSDEHILFTLRHNSIWDGWSFDIFRHELAGFYEAPLDRPRADHNRFPGCTAGEGWQLFDRR